MKYIFLIGSIVFGIAGISQAMDAFKADGASLITHLPIVFNLQYISISFQPTPGFVKVLVLSFGCFILFLIRQRLKDLGFNGIQDYFPS